MTLEVTNAASIEDFAKTAYRPRETAERPRESEK
jgi:hypothetical protein